MAVGQLRRRIGATAPVRALTDARPVARLLSLRTYSRLTETPVRFAASELTLRRQRATYRLQGADVVVTVRHGTPDLFTLDQTFHQGHLEPPAEIAAVLARKTRPLTVVDLGANIGMFGAFVLQRFPVERMIAFEPDPGNVGVLRETIRANGREQDWRVVPACAGVAPGSLLFAPDEFGVSRIATAGDRHTIEVDVVDALPYLADADLVKIDVEGAEWDLLRDQRFAQLRRAVVCLEYHPRGCPAAQPREAAR
ncbi:MAG: FkbM family methyltransferase, partial [Thermoleophilaceae bacterium]